MRQLASLLLFTTLAVAQQDHLTAHPQETLQNGSGNLAPFGCNNGGGISEGHAQILLRAAELPGPGAILVGIEAHCQSPVNFTYTSLQIQVAPTTATALSMTFAANLVAPTPVLSGVMLPVAWGNGWTQIPFTTFYAHDGVSSLVIDIQKVVDSSTFSFATMSTPSSPPRIDRPLMVYAFGSPGSGMSAATTAFAAADALAIRLVWQNVPTLRNRSDLGGNNSHQYGLGGSIVTTVSGTAGSLYLSQIGTSLLPVPVGLPPVIGLLRISGVTYVVSFLDGSGLAVGTINIPNNPGLVGSYFVHQSAVLDALSNLPLFTNAMDHFVNS